MAGNGGSSRGEPNFLSEVRRPPIDSLTGLRFVAAIYVVLFHTQTRLARDHGAPKSVVLFLSHGYLAVTLFFILSGYVLTYNYADRWNSTSFPKFLRARLARLYPVYVLALIFQLNFYWTHATFLKTVTVLSMVQSWTVLPSKLPPAWNYPAWTLSIEMLFYLCFPFLLYLVKRTRNKVLWLWVTCLISLIIGGAQAAIGGRLTWFTNHVPLPLLRLPEFYLGMLLVDYSPKRLPFGRWTMFVVLTAIFVLLSLNTHRFVTLIIFPFAGLIWLLANSSGTLQRILQSKLLVLLGGASYAIYLLQEPLRRWMVAIYNSRFSSFLASCLYFTVLIAVGVVVFQFFERPMRQWIRR